MSLPSARAGGLGGTWPWVTGVTEGMGSPGGAQSQHPLLSVQTQGADLTLLTPWEGNPGPRWVVSG